MLCSYVQRSKVANASFFARNSCVCIRCGLCLILIVYSAVSTKRHNIAVLTGYGDIHAKT